MNPSIKDNVNSLQLSDLYSLMFFILYKVQDIPEYTTLSELCYLLDGNNMTRLLTYFAGKTITIPTKEEFVILTDALLLYKYINLDGVAFADAQKKLSDVTLGQRDKITDLYLKIIPILKNYNFDRSYIDKYER